MTDLTPYNTLRVPAKAREFIRLNSPDQLLPLVQAGKFSQPFFILGWGANVLFTKDFPGTIFKNNITGIKIVTEDDKSVLLEVASGHSWIDLVNFTVSRNWSGMENLAYIPGSVGAAPYGNIAAYGQSQADICVRVEVFDLTSGQLIQLTDKECGFDYRDSAFKHHYKDKFFITKVWYRLSKTAHFDTSYYSRNESLASQLATFASPPYSPADIAQAVTQIRQIKMPEWTQVGTAGSFFKNPFVTKQKLAQLQERISELQYYPTQKMLYPRPQDPVFETGNIVKIPAGRLLEELGWKNKRVGHVGTFAKHALVIVNYGQATGQEIFEFSEKMRHDVKKHFDINLEYEVIVI